MKLILLLSLLSVTWSVSNINSQVLVAALFECLPSMRGDGVCDLPCYYELDDGGDCTRRRVCAQLAGDGFCDILCYSEEFRWDGGDCEHCPSEIKGDGHCDLQCLSSPDKDGGDCLDCPVEWRGNGVCDVECLSARGEWDRQDCYRNFTV